jgi:hypothetical protein
MPTATVSTPLNWDVLVTKRHGLTRDLPTGSANHFRVRRSS